MLHEPQILDLEPLQGSETLAQTELKEGSDAEAMQLAHEIVSTHPAQISRMQELMKTL